MAIPYTGGGGNITYPQVNYPIVTPTVPYREKKTFLEGLLEALLPQIPGMIQGGQNKAFYKTLSDLMTKPVENVSLPQTTPQDVFAGLQGEGGQQPSFMPGESPQQPTFMGGMEPPLPAPMYTPPIVERPPTYGEQQFRLQGQGLPMALQARNPQEALRIYSEVAKMFPEQISPLEREKLELQKRGLGLEERGVVVKEKEFTRKGEPTGKVVYTIDESGVLSPIATIPIGSEIRSITSKTTPDMMDVYQEKGGKLTNIGTVPKGTRILTESETTPSGEKLPSWGQEQKVKAIKAGLRQGVLVLADVLGQPIRTEIKTLEQAIEAIIGEGLDPALFANELKRFGYVPVTQQPIRIGGYTVTPK